VSKAVEKVTSQLAEFQRRATEAVTEPTSEAEVFPCAQCSQFFTTSTALNSHKKFVHRRNTHLQQTELEMAMAAEQEAELERARTAALVAEAELAKARERAAATSAAKASIKLAFRRAVTKASAVAAFGTGAPATDGNRVESCLSDEQSQIPPADRSRISSILRRSTFSAVLEASRRVEESRITLEDRTTISRLIRQTSFSKAAAALEASRNSTEAAAIRANISRIIRRASISKAAESAAAATTRDSIARVIRRASFSAAAAALSLGDGLSGTPVSGAADAEAVDHRPVDTRGAERREEDARLAAQSAVAAVTRLSVRRLSLGTLEAQAAQATQAAQAAEAAAQAAALAAVKRRAQSLLAGAVRTSILRLECQDRESERVGDMTRQQMFAEVRVQASALHKDIQLLTKSMDVAISERGCVSDALTLNKDIQLPNESMDRAICKEGRASEALVLNREIRSPTNPMDCAIRKTSGGEKVPAMQQKGALLKRSVSFKAPEPDGEQYGEHNICAIQRASRRWLSCRDRTQSGGSMRATSPDCVALFGRYAWSGHKVGLTAEGLKAALRQACPQMVCFAQVDAIWQSFREGTDRMGMDLKTFCSLVQALVQGGAAAAEFADLAPDDFAALWDAQALAEASAAHVAADAIAAAADRAVSRAIAIAATPVAAPVSIQSIGHSGSALPTQQMSVMSDRPSPDDGAAATGGKADMMPMRQAQQPEVSDHPAAIALATGDELSLELEPTRWSHIFQVAVQGSSSPHSLDRATFQLALCEARLPLRGSQVDQLWTTFLEGTGRSGIDLHNFCAMVEAIATDICKAAEWADMAPEDFVALGSDDVLAASVASSSGEADYSV